MELIHIANATFSSSRIKSNHSNHSLENLASKTKLTGLLKSTRCAGGAARSGEPAREDGLASSCFRGQWQAWRENWWSQPGSNRRPSGCKPDALPAELWPRHGFRMPRERPRACHAVGANLRGSWRHWWVWEELHLRPHPYQGCALTN